MASQEALPGGFELAERLYCIGCNFTFTDGYKWMHGQQGEVMGPATGEERSTSLSVLFPGNNDTLEIRITQLSHSPPVMNGKEVYRNGIAVC